MRTVVYVAEDVFEVAELIAGYAEAGAEYAEEIVEECMGWCDDHSHH